MTETDGEITPIILASGSPRRRELLSLLGLPLKVIPSDADESFQPEWMPEHIVSTLALRKAEAVLPQAGNKPGVVVGSDTIVVLDGRVLGKPRNESEARDMLASLQGRSHSVFTGLACVWAGQAGEVIGALPEDIWKTVPGEPGDTADAASPELGNGNDGIITPLPFGGLGRYAVIPGPSREKPLALAGYTESRVTFRPMTSAEIASYIATGEPMDKAGSYGIQGIGSVFIERMEGDFYSVMGLPLNLLYKMLSRFGISPF
ncbi:MULTISPECIES: Maf family protein [Paenibacillus]|uniref:Maf family protein n=1 Tax=Paenibacillus TaxID=44249 RepID=UPI001F1CC799|nr:MULTISPECIES: Maf family protein [Paenibacillus]